MTRAHPQVSVFIKSGTTQQLYEAVHAEEVDLATGVSPDFALSKSFEWKPLWEESVVLRAIAMMVSVALGVSLTPLILRGTKSHAPHGLYFLAWFGEKTNKILVGEKYFRSAPKK